MWNASSLIRAMAAVIALAALAPRAALAGDFDGRYDMGYTRLVAEVTVCWDVGGARGCAPLSGSLSAQLTGPTWRWEDPGARAAAEELEPLGESDASGAPRAARAAAAEAIEGSLPGSLTLKQDSFAPTAVTVVLDAGEPSALTLLGGIDPRSGAFSAGPLVSGTLAPDTGRGEGQLRGVVDQVWVTGSAALSVTGQVRADFDLRRAP